MVALQSPLKLRRAGDIVQGGMARSRGDDGGGRGHPIEILHEDVDLVVINKPRTWWSTLRRVTRRARW